MDIQLLLVAIIIIGALSYAGQMLWRKAKSFSGKSACGTNCGCEGKQKKSF